jgi:hypothetical protein
MLRPIVLAARAITNLIEALPGASTSLVAVEDCIPELCMKLMNISDIEVAEQSLYVIHHSHQLLISYSSTIGLLGWLGIE